MSAQKENMAKHRHLDVIGKQSEVMHLMEYLTDMKERLNQSPVKKSGNSKDKNQNVKDVLTAIKIAEQVFVEYQKIS